MKFVLLYFKVAVMAGFAGKEPLVMVMKFVMLTVPPDGIVNAE